MIDAEWFLQGHSHEGYRPEVTEKQVLLKEARKLMTKIEHKQYEVKRLIDQLYNVKSRLKEMDESQPRGTYVTEDALGSLSHNSDEGVA